MEELISSLPSSEITTHRRHDMEELKVFLGNPVMPEERVVSC